MSTESSIYTSLPVDSSRWSDLEKLFGPKGACAGCWCMYWRLKRQDFERQSGDGNRESLRHLVKSGRPLGLIAYADGEPVGWCAVAPRADYPTLDRSRVLHRVDDQPVWSISCFFVARRKRHKGVTDFLVRAAVEYARQQGASVVEAYPVEPRQNRYPDSFAYTGFAATFQKAGFFEAARRSPTRPIFRLNLNPE